ncbi:serine hydrolase domain-containing protein [Aneurinibacillus aneurinilyticus]|jgi:CubicO group peptidase (beta-lactamase class C family)|uniref:serine hydrolase domain-containing protein n=1 Tax=Aneurinibacillus aneurinilyticus TaxID=1391 RepID=UPI0023F49419|nr:serine hydrolase domain-containing protein [Aneurinibacillus aneurinilyticus]
MKQTYTHALHGIETWLEDTFHEWKVPGLAVAFVNKEQVLYASGLGVRSLDECKAVRPETQFAIGSATKPFTTTLLSILIEEGFLQWDTPIKEYIPSFQMFDPFATERMTLRDMACHRSGLPRHELVAYRSTLTREELVARLRYLEPKYCSCLNSDAVVTKPAHHLPVFYLTAHVTSSLAIPTAMYREKQPQT